LPALDCGMMPGRIKLRLAMSVRFLQLDVFCDRAGRGNPLGVVIGAEQWSEAAMQAFAGWLNLVETTYLLPASVPAASYRLRIFTPTREIAFAGHPTVGSAHAALQTGWVQARDSGLVQECGAGLLPIRIRGAGDSRRLFVQAPAARVLMQGATAQERLQEILGTLQLGRLAPAFVEGGRRWWMAELASEQALREWRPPHAAIAALARDSESLGLCVFARVVGAAYQLVVRAFPAGVGIVEDPASGAANGLIAAYIAQCDPDPGLAQGYSVSQGRELGRDARIDVEIDGDRQVWVGGQTHTVLDAQVNWPVDLTEQG
jgi:PhzF family phenazine biosynthesis protein